jgi:hypothetical protein
MPFIMYYSPEENAIGQTYVPPGTPLDIYASQLGIIEMSLDELPGVPFIQVTLPAEDAT